MIFDGSKGRVLKNKRGGKEDEIGSFFFRNNRRSQRYLW
jgi:hypothetical protein